MDKIQLIERIIEMHPQLKQKDAETTVKVILDALCSTLAKGGRIEIRGFGSFSLNRLPPKQKPSTKAGFKLKEPPRYIPCFKPAKELRARANKCNGEAIVELFPHQPISAGLLVHDGANDAEPDAIYA
jgi:integration host factor subunit beta